LGYEDSGNANKIYGLNPKENSKHHYQNAENIDWEEITKDKEGNLYIGDLEIMKIKRRFMHL
jgi:hypothetical protein